MKFQIMMVSLWVISIYLLINLALAEWLIKDDLMDEYEERSVGFKRRAYWKMLFLGLIIVIFTIYRVNKRNDGSTT